MEGPFRLLVVVGLLAALLPAAAATFGPQQPGTPCEPTLLATQVALFCAPDMPTAQCCEPVVAAVDLGGGVPCLCRVAAEPQIVMAGLNATHLLTLYTSCGGLRPGGAHLAAACDEPKVSPPANVSSQHPSAAPRSTRSTRTPSKSSEMLLLPPHQLTVPPYSKAFSTNLSVRLSKDDINEEALPCDYPKLASDIADFCGTNIPNSTCCIAVVAAVDIGGCFCKVILEESIVTGPFGGRHILFLYNSCGGLRPLSYQELADCDTTVNSPPVVNISTIKCNYSGYPIDVYNVAKINTVLLGVILFLVIGQATLFFCIWLKAKLHQTRSSPVLSSGVLPVHRVELAQRTRGRLTQSDGGAGSFGHFHQLLPTHTRRNERVD